MIELPKDHPTQVLFYTVMDPLAPFDHCPAITSMLHKLELDDAHKFDCAMRIVGLYMKAAYDLGQKDAKTAQAFFE